MSDGIFTDDKHAKATIRAVWIGLTAVFTFIAGAFASRSEWTQFRAVLALWILIGLLLSVGLPNRNGRR